jgi:peptidoglycan-associated lipoprotein
MLIAMGTLATMGCGAEPKPIKPPMAEATIKVGTVQRAGASLGVSDDLARACKIQLSDPGSAPRFDFDRSELLPGDQAVLSKIAECLTTGPLRGRSVQLVGRADARGEPQYNMALGAHRANGVADYLAHAGLDRTHLDLTSRGALDATGVDEAGQQNDRRVDIVLMQ